MKTKKYTIKLKKSDEELKNFFLNLSSQYDIAKLLDIAEKDLTYWLYGKADTEKYITFGILKKSKEIRTINAPIHSLKIIQLKLNYILNLIYEPKIATYGFVKKQIKKDAEGNEICDSRTIISNAKLHTNKKYVLNIDLQNFFPSINFGRVYGAFQSEPYNLPEKVAKVLAKICCLNNELPQGAPTSPVVSNIICRSLDNSLTKLAKKYKCTYSRYADDITFSTNLNFFPSLLAKYKPENKVLKYIIGKELKQIIIDNGFKINRKKVRIQTKMERQEVTGIVVNKKTNINRNYIKQVRAMLHAWEKYSEEKAEDFFYEKYYFKQSRISETKPKFREVLLGKIDFIKQVRGEEDDIYRKLYNKYFTLIDEYQKVFPLVNSNTEQSRIIDFINKGESEFVEFKETYGYCYAIQNNIKELSYSNGKGQKTESSKFKVLKAINAFLNSQKGGHVFLGITDKHKIVGLEKDFIHLKNEDEFQRDVLTAIENHFNPKPFEKVTIKFHKIYNVVICRLEIKPSKEIIFFNDCVFVRTGNKSPELKGHDLIEWGRENNKIALQCPIN